MSRIPAVDPAATSGYVAKILDGQAAAWGAPLNNHLVYAHRPDLFRAVRGMWTALDKDGELGGALVSLINRRVAQLNGCVF
jgi:alkylhydroperoxidase family enzyme